MDSGLVDAAVRTVAPVATLLGMVTWLVRWIVKRTAAEIAAVREDAAARVADWKTHAEGWQQIATRMQDESKERSLQYAELLEGQRTVRSMLEGLGRQKGAA